jgi:hypothetical protein
MKQKTTLRVFSKKNKTATKQGPGAGRSATNQHSAGKMLEIRGNHPCPAQKSSQYF